MVTRRWLKFDLNLGRILPELKASISSIVLKNIIFFSVRACGATKKEVNFLFNLA